jgi:hypothetical protein
MDGLQLQWLRDLEGFDLLKHWRIMADAILRSERYDRGGSTSRTWSPAVAVGH